jgi:hypothetical protein
MAWQASRRNQHRVEAQIEIGVFGMGHQPGLGRFDDAPLLAERDRIGRLVEAGAALNPTNASRFRRRATMSISP